MAVSKAGEMCIVSFTSSVTIRRTRIAPEILKMHPKSTMFYLNSAVDVGGSNDNLMAVLIYMFPISNLSPLYNCGQGVEKQRSIYLCSAAIYTSLMLPNVVIPDQMKVPLALLQYTWSRTRHIDV